LLTASCDVDKLMAVAAGRTRVSAWVAVVLESSASVYQYRITITQLLLDVYRHTTTLY